MNTPPTTASTAPPVHHGALHVLGVYAAHHTGVVLIVVFIAYVLVRFNQRAKARTSRKK